MINFFKGLIAKRAETLPSKGPEPSSETVNPDHWQPLFHSYDEIQNAPPLTFAIHGWLQAEGITMYGGLPGHGKTLLGLSTAKALLTGEPLFGYEHFNVNRAKRVLYLCPEVGLGPLLHRIKLFRLMPFLKSGQLLVRSLSAPEAPLTDVRILRAAEGSDVFLDTAVRFMEGNENEAAEQRVFAKNLFAVLSAGARSVTGLHHSPKAFADAPVMTLENALRGTNELGAMLSTAWGTKRVSEKTVQLYIQNIKPRDFDPVEAFILEGRPWIDQTGDFKMIVKPGMAGDLRGYQGQDMGGRPSEITGAKAVTVRQMAAQHKPHTAIARAVGVDRRTVSRFLRTVPIVVGNN